ncbi:transmembrane protein adipocyte-associated 1 homolog [Dysidea avara]|uniref:transmembrane protein adipocyte-associated 1 homolog n=1 Tax=Dysidea avara TaxID=196820 RepID=UPI0033260AB5
MLANRSIPWCSIVICNSTKKLGASLMGANSSNEASCDSDKHFCVRVLHDTIHRTNVRYVDILILVPTFLYFVFLTWCLLRQWRTIAKRPLCTILFVFVYMITISGVVCKAVSLSVSYKSDMYKVCALVLRGSILVSEISVLIFGVALKFYRRSRILLLVTVLIIFVIGVAFTTTEGVLEFKHLHTLPCSKYNFFTHGGMIFLFCTSTFFCFAYLCVFLIYLFRLHQKWSLPSRASFYYYALFLSLVNAVQAVGSMLWYKGLHEQQLGQSGICMVTLTTVLYEILYVPMTYWIFLRNFLRSKQSSESSTYNAVIPQSTNGLLSKVFFRSTSHSYGSTQWIASHMAEEEEDSDEEDESGLFSSGSVFSVRTIGT